MKKYKSVEEGFFFRIGINIIFNYLPVLSIFISYIFLHEYYKYGSIFITIFLISNIFVIIIAENFFRSFVVDSIARIGIILLILVSLYASGLVSIYDNWNFVGVLVAYTFISIFNIALMTEESTFSRVFAFVILSISYLGFVGFNIAKSDYLMNHSLPLFTIFDQAVNLKFWEAYVFVNIISFVFAVFSFITLLISRIISLSKISRKLRVITSWHLDDDFVEKNILKEEDISLRHNERTILFGDIRGFTSFSEKNDVRLVVMILRQLYNIVEQNVKKYNGYKPEFIADEFITFFDNPTSAVKCAFRLNKEVNLFLSKFDLGIGMGLDCGNVIEGMVGGATSKKYTVLGKSVNTAARLQASAIKGEILVSKNVLDQISNVKFEKVEGITLKGVDPGFEIFRLLGRIRKNSSRSSQNVLQKFGESFKLNFVNK